MRTFRLGAVASLALLALGACGSQQGAALFVGDERVSESTIDGYVQEVAERNVESSADEGADASTDVSEALAQLDYTPYREGVVEYVAYAELGRALGLEADTASNEGWDAVVAEADSYFQQLLEQTESRELTAEETAAVEEASEVDQTLASASLDDLQLLAGFTDLLNGYIDEFDITANPRYGEVNLSPVDSVFTAVVPQR